MSPPLPPPICSAVRSAVRSSGLTQEALAARMGEKQQTISGWMLTREPRLNDISRIEKALDKPGGFLLRAAGYVADPVRTRECLLADPNLVEAHRQLLIASYDSAIELARREARTRRRPDENPRSKSKI